MIANINKSEEDVIFKRFHGATSEEIAFYAHKPLSDTKAEKVIVIAGTNDLTNAVYQNRGYVNQLEITEHLTDWSSGKRSWCAENFHLWRYGAVGTPVSKCHNQSQQPPPIEMQ